MPLFSCFSPRSQAPRQWNIVPALGREYRLGDICDGLGNVQSTGAIQATHSRPGEAFHPLAFVNDDIQGFAKALHMSQEILLNLIVGNIKLADRGSTNSLMGNICEKGNQNRVISLLEFSCGNQEISSKDIRKIKKTIPRNTRSPHIVRSVSKGSRVFLVFEPTNYDSTQTDAMKEALKSCVKRLGDDGFIDQKGLKTLSNFSCETISDVVGIPQFDITNPKKSYTQLQNKMKNASMDLEVDLCEINSANSASKDTYSLANDYYNELVTLKSDLKHNTSQPISFQSLAKVEHKFKEEVSRYISGLATGRSTVDLDTVLREIDKSAGSELKRSLLADRGISRGIRNRKSLRKMASDWRASIRGRQQNLMRDFIKVSTPVSQSKRPQVYKLPLKTNSKGQFEIDDDIRASNTCKQQTVIFLGSEGAGKSALVNSMTNYMFGVDGSDPHRFILTNEDQTGGDNTPTKDISVYNLHGRPGFRHEQLSLTLVDVPGFSGHPESDDIVFNQIIQILEEPQLNGQNACIALVIKSFKARLDAADKYMYNLLKRVGDTKPDIPKVLFLTFCDANEAQVLNALDEAGLNMRESYSFNNSVLYREAKEGISKELWKLQFDSFKTFFQRFH